MTLAGNLLVLVSALPLIWRTVHPLIPPQYVESYAYWDAAALNTPDEAGRVPAWRNMGYWDGSKDESFTHANAALASKLLEFSGAKLDGNTLDVGFGGGETLLLHLSHGASVTGITTLPRDAESARALVESEFPNADIDIFTGSASYAPEKDPAHPLNPLRPPKASDAAQTALPTDAAPYDLVYALDAAYHIPPAVMTFASNVHAALAPGGTLAYTDVLPPAKYSSMPWRILGMWLALPLGVPHRNMIDRPKTLELYKEQLERIGYTDVQVQDWSANVWDGIAGNLEKREGAAWHIAAQGFRYAGSKGWKFIAVRATRGELRQQQQEREEEHDHEEHEEL